MDENVKFTKKEDELAFLMSKPKLRVRLDIENLRPSNLSLQVHPYLNEIIDVISGAMSISKASFLRACILLGLDNVGVDADKDITVSSELYHYLTISGQSTFGFPLSMKELVSWFLLGDYDGSNDNEAE
ncbi:MAG: hypothetical protein AELANPGJ_03585 [Anaerolineae bacterium]|nr:hypothetical protein [Anaerolineae bacterium]